jgi:hypothetical protein
MVFQGWNQLDRIEERNNHFPPLKPELYGRRRRDQQNAPDEQFHSQRFAILKGSRARSRPRDRACGSGNDIWNNADEFTYVYKSFTDPNANKTFSAKIVSQQRTSGWAKAGIMIRMGTNADSRHISILATPDNGVQWTYRTTNGGATVHPAVTGNWIKAPVYVRIVKTGGRYAGSYSTNGTNWSPLGSAVDLSTSSPYYAGMAVSSNNPAMSSVSFNTVSF